ncbi:MAG: radical SAM protein, partial [Lentisphaerae bacterium]
AFTLPLPAFTRHTRANVKIQDGCNCKCAYCTIPSARGPSRSRQFEDILREVDALQERGYREIVFTGINIGTYHDGSRRLLQLIEAVLANSSVERLRLSSLEPAMIPKGLLELMKRYEGRLCRHLHISLQSGSPATLKRMNRPYPLEKIVAFIHKAVETIPQLAVGVDVIAGFPGEDEREFEETCQTLRNLPIAYGHVFSFSERPHAPITAQPDIPRVDPRTIQERNRILREIVAGHKRRFLETLCRDQASPLRVLVEQYRAPYWEGHTDHYVQVCIQAPESAALRNEILDVIPLSLQDERILAVPRQNTLS